MNHTKFVRFIFTAVVALGLTCIPKPIHAAQFFTTANSGFSGVFIPISNPGATNLASALWTNATITAGVVAVPGNTYEVLANTVAIGNNLANTKVRGYAANAAGTALLNAVGNSYPTNYPVFFPGDSLQLDINAELRLKDAGGLGAGTIYSLPGVGGNPGLILNGGFVTTGDNWTAEESASAGGGPGVIEYNVVGLIKANPGTTSYLCTGNNDFGSADTSRNLQLGGAIIGSGTIVICQGGLQVTNVLITGTNSSFSGAWIDKAGWFVATGPDSLGTNSNITIDPNFYLASPPFDPSAQPSAVNGPARLEVGYNVNDAGTLILTNGGQMLLHQDCSFGGVIVEGASLTNGTYSLAQLTSLFTNFIAGGCAGSITVRSYSTAPPTIAPTILQQPLPAVVFAGDTGRFTINACGSPPLFYQWQRNGTNLSDAGNISGSLTANLKVSNVSAADVAPYNVIVSHTGSSVTSSVVSLSLGSPSGEAYESAVLAGGPTAFYEFNETTSPSGGGVEAFDFVGSYNGLYGTGVLNGANSIAGPVPPGFPGFESTNAAAQFANANGASQVIVPAWNLNGTNVTITAWINPAGPQTNNAGMVVCRAGTTTAGLVYGGSTNASGDYTLGSVWGAQGFNSKFAAPPGQWSLVALAVTPSNTTLYLFNANGLLSASTSATNPKEPFDGSTYIGDDSADNGSGTRSFNGIIDDVAIFNTSLSVSNLTLLYAAASGVSNFAPEIAVQPVSLSPVYLGVTAHFSVLAGGTAPLSYQWMAGVHGSGSYTNLSDATNIVGGVTNVIQGSATPNLTIASTTSGNAGDYVVVVTNGFAPSAQSSVGTLSLIPESGEQEEAYVISLGPVAFYEFNETNVNPTPGPAPAFDFAGGYTGVYGVNVANGFNGIAGPDAASGFPGFAATNSAVAIAPAADENVAVPPWNLNSVNITVTAWINPTFGSQNNQAGLVFCRSGSTVAGLNYSSFQTGGNSVLGYTWNNNDPNTTGWNSGLVAPVGQWSLVALVVTANNATLFVVTTNALSAAIHTYPHISEAFDGTTLIGDDSFDNNNGTRCFYGTIDNVAVFNKALNTNQILGIFTNAWGQPAFPVSLVSQPQSRSIYAGLTATLSASFQGSAPFHYQWQGAVQGSGNFTNIPAGGNVSGAPSATTSGNSAALVITNAGPTNFADYLVVVTNAENAVTSSVATLIIQPRSGEGYQLAVINSKPIAFYEFNETGNPATNGVVAFDYIGGFNGIYGPSNLDGFDGITGPVPAEGFPNFLPSNLATEFIPTNIGGSLGATSSPVRVPPWNLNANTVTITAWINPNAMTNGQPSPAIAMCRKFGLVTNGTTTASGFTIEGFNAGRPVLGYNWNDDAATYGWVSGVIVPTNQWSFVALAVGPSFAQVYLFNTNQVSTAVNIHNHAAAPFDSDTLIGEDPFDDGGNGERAGDRVLDATLDDVAVYNRTLLLSDLVNLFKAASGITYGIPAITKGPGSLTVVAGQTAQFSVTATGGLLSYQWASAPHGSGLFTNLTDGTLPNGAIIAGSATTNLTISNVTSAQAADYVVAVTNGLGSVLSSPVATLTVLPPLPATITNKTLVGTTLTLAGSGGQANGPYYLLTSTNVALPLANWVSIATNTFNAAGHFSISTTISPGEAERFYVIASPY